MPLAGRQYWTTPQKSYVTSWKTTIHPGRTSKQTVTKVSAAQLQRAKQRLTMEWKLREDVDKLQSQMIIDRKATQPSPQPNKPSYTAPPPYRYSYRYNTPLMPPPQTQVAAPPPPSSFQPPALPLTPQVPQTPQAAHLFAPAAPMTRGNLFYSYRGYPQTPSRRGGSPADRMRTAAQYATIPHHPNSDAGKQAYAQQIQEWHTQHGTDAIPNSQRPYPLKPGTSPIWSRECFNCGMAMTPPHQAYDCPNEAVPMQEMKWRETVSRLVSRTLTAPTTPGPTSNVQFVANAAPAQYTMPQSPYTAPTQAYPQYSYFADPYKITPDIPTSSLPSVPTSAFPSQFNTSAPNSPNSQTPETLNIEEADDDLVMPTINVTSPDSDVHSISMPDCPDLPLSTSLHVDSHSIANTDTLSLWVTVLDPVDHNTSTNSSFVTLSLVSTCESKPASDCYSGENDHPIVDVYAISDNDHTTDHTPASTPFVTQIVLYGPGAKTSCFQANIDDGAMINAIDLKTFNKASKHLRKLTRSNRMLRMANGAEVPSHGVWMGTL
ncbi:hypothetical protein DFJ58DRAFT_848077 [Suillus subalutaceus]|uniref:uncharacterized protein n=1 Tax=Suillus subalutaceus TaxID=48586 RepID=UPI001B884673|nr:uncharacterized protein DFJ58DRAFT_848077 [Suillus subalutaceus]KAG1832266.1 hypothetical protein DFJ58DRAFT_848077 [Suillus subalutaceus]